MEGNFVFLFLRTETIIRDESLLRENLDDNPKLKYCLLLYHVFRQNVVLNAEAQNSEQFFIERNDLSRRFRIHSNIETLLK